MRNAFILILLISTSTFAEYNIGINCGISEYFYKNNFEEKYNSNFIVFSPMYLHFDWSKSAYWGTQTRFGLINREIKDEIQVTEIGTVEDGNVIKQSGTARYVESNYYISLMNKIKLKIETASIIPYLSFGIGLDYYIFTNYDMFGDISNFKQNTDASKFLFTIEPEIGIEKKVNRFVFSLNTGFNKNINDIYKNSENFKTITLYALIGVSFVFGAPHLFVGRR
jgi:hypothetical protein